MQKKASAPANHALNPFIEKHQKDVMGILHSFVFRFTIIWESMIVIIRENRAEVIEIIWERVEPRAA
jgi:hypothetical protein